MKQVPTPLNRHQSATALLAVVVAVSAVALTRRRSASASKPEDPLAPLADSPSVDEVSAR